MDARFEPEFLTKLMEIWPDPETGKTPLSQASLARKTGISQPSISNYLKPKGQTGAREPGLAEMRKLDVFFKIIRFSSDGNKTIDNQAVLSAIKAFLETQNSHKRLA